MKRFLARDRDTGAAINSTLPCCAEGRPASLKPGEKCSCITVYTPLFRPVSPRMASLDQNMAK
jgi:hypothetical protein